MNYLRTRVSIGLAALAMSAVSIIAALPATAQAAELLVFGSAHCPYCLAWEQEIGRTYSKTDEGHMAPLRRFDVHATLPGNLAKIDRVKITPTFVLVDKGREVGRIVGYHGEYFWPELQRLLDRLPENG